jgi:hypothetical protein
MGLFEFSITIRVLVDRGLEREVSAMATGSKAPGQHVERRHDRQNDKTRYKRDSFKLRMMTFAILHTLFVLFHWTFYVLFFQHDMNGTSTL